MPIEEISLRPELSSPARFRIQGGSPERDGVGGVGVVVAGRHFSFLSAGDNSEISKKIPAVGVCLSPGVRINQDRMTFDGLIIVFNTNIYDIMEKIKITNVTQFSSGGALVQ